MFSSLLPKPKHAAHNTIPVLFTESKASSNILMPTASRLSEQTSIIPHPNSSAQKTLAELHLDLNGSLNYAKSVVLASGGTKSVQASYEDTIPLKVKYPNLKHHFPRYTLHNCPDSSLATCLEDTRLVVEKLLAQKEGIEEKENGPTFLTYTPTSLDDDERGRTIEIRNYKEDPMLPPKFKLRKNRHKNPSPPPPILRSAPKEKVTKEMKDKWSIPSAVSNWKNNQGFAISLEKRMMAASGGKIDTGKSINLEKFGLLSQALEAADQQAREEIRIRNEKRQELAIQEQREKELQLKELVERNRQDKHRNKRSHDDYSDNRKRSKY